eukprot:Selendium_serpulae@DN4301_c2_g1_i1.p1
MVWHPARPTTRPPAFGHSLAVDSRENSPQHSVQSTESPFTLDPQRAANPPALPTRGQTPGWRLNAAMGPNVALARGPDRGIALGLPDPSPPSYISARTPPSLPCLLSGSSQLSEYTSDSGSLSSSSPLSFPNLVSAPSPPSPLSFPNLVSAPSPPSPLSFPN